MQRLEVSGAVRFIYRSLGVKGLSWLVTLHDRSHLGHMSKNDEGSSSVMQVHSYLWLTLCYLADEIRDDGMEARCNSHGKLKNHVQYFSQRNRGNKSPTRPSHK